MLQCVVGYGTSLYLVMWWVGDSLVGKWWSGQSYQYLSAKRSLCSKIDPCNKFDPWSELFMLRGSNLLGGHISYWWVGPDHHSCQLAVYAAWIKSVVWVPFCTDEWKESVRGDLCVTQCMGNNVMAVGVAH